VLARRIGGSYHRKKRRTLSHLHRCEKVVE